MLMDVISSPRGSARCRKEWRSGVEEQRAMLSEHICPEGLQFENMYIPKPSVVKEYFETYILPIIFFMYGGILSLTHSHLYHY